MQKICVKIAKKLDLKIARYMLKREVRLIFYAICVVVPVFITGIRMKEIKCAISLQHLRLKKVHFFMLFYTNLGRN